MDAIKSRQQYIQKQLKTGQAFILQQPKAKKRNNDVYYPFHPNRHFYYLTGLEEPNALLLITHDQVILWSEPNDPHRTLWEGKLMGEQALDLLMIDKWHSLHTVSETISNYLSPEIQLLSIESIPDIPFKPTQSNDIRSLLDTMRLIKDPLEITYIKKACQISSAAHNSIMRHAKDLHHEGAIAGHFIKEIMCSGASSLAYPTISASGKNACTLHYQRNNQDINPDDLILVDAGCEYMQYASDITRTFPANGRFSPLQKDVYEAVLATQESTIKMCAPNIKMSDIHNHAVKEISQHLIDLKLLNCSLDEAINEKLFMPFFPHKIGHTMGLDVHDTPLNDDILQPGMVITIEPGIYISSPGQLNGIGIRIEDNILITQHGYDNLTKDAVKQVDDIEHMMSS
ncbi:MAG: aminopeptidase P family protein [Pseudomonadota bacterium]|nr:aminopeptidase P family protein [Pseudomonadota bacterium]